MFQRVWKKSKFIVAKNFRHFLAELHLTSSTNFHSRGDVCDQASAIRACSWWWRQWRQLFGRWKYAADTWYLWWKVCIDRFDIYIHERREKTVVFIISFHQLSLKWTNNEKKNLDPHFNENQKRNDYEWIGLIRHRHRFDIHSSWLKLIILCLHYLVVEIEFWIIICVSKLANQKKNCEQSFIYEI